MAQAKKFGTFGGVFTPSILTILGVIMYLRLPTIVGQAGLWQALMIIAVAHIISVCTGLSVSSIATDRKVRAGGTYFMISRSLGLPIGGTLGLALFVGLSLSVSMYLIGFAESFLAWWDLPVTLSSLRITATIALLAVTAVTLISTALALQTQFYIMAAIALSLVSIILGNHDLAPQAAALEAAPSAAPFIVLFGIFFPAVTGFEAGVSMSGDLRDAKRSIPVGTIAAIVVGLAVYAALATFLALTVSQEQLANNPRVLLDIARVPELVIAGIWGATISSAFGSILGAPRILQATSADRITPHWFAKGYGRGNEPRHALILTFVIAWAGILIGELDAIARIVSMFFITTYGFLNITAALESRVSPDFRPEFRVPAAIGVIGAAASFIVMIQLDFIAAVGATLLLGLVYLVLKRRHLRLDTGDAWDGVWSTLARAALARLHRAETHRRNWRPNVLLFDQEDGGERAPLLELGRQLAARRGVLTHVEIVPPGEAALAVPRDDDDPDEVFHRRFEAADTYDGIEQVARLHGFAGIEPNTVLLGWPRRARHPDRFAAVLGRLAALDHNVLVLDHDAARGFGRYATIDVWWRLRGNDVAFSLNLVRFLTTSDDWRDARVRFLTVNDGDSSLALPIRRELQRVLGEARVEAEVQVVNNAVQRRRFIDIVRAESGDADLTIAGLADIGRGDPHRLIERTNALLDAMGTLLLVHASSGFREPLLDVPPAAIAAALRPDTSVEPVAAPPPLDPAAAGDGVLAPLFGRLDHDARAVLEAWDEAYFERVHTLSHDALQDAGRLALAALEDGAAAAPLRRADVLTRTRALVTQTAERLERLREDTGVQRVLLACAVAELLPSPAQLVAGLPREVRVKSPAERFRATSADDAVTRAVKLWRRAIAFVRRREPDHATPLADMATALAQEHMARLIEERMTAFAVAAAGALAAIERMLGSALDGLAAAEADAEPARARTAAAVLRDELDRLEAGHRTALAQSRRSAAGAAREWVGALARQAARIDARRAHRESRRARPAESRIAALVGAPDAWQDVQERLLEQTLLSLRLVEGRAVLENGVGVERERLTTALEMRVIRPMADLAAAIRAAAGSGRGLPLETTDHAAAAERSSEPRVLLERLRSLVTDTVARLPVRLPAVAEESLEDVQAGNFDGAAVAELPARQAAEYVMETELLGPAGEHAAAAETRLIQQLEVQREVVRLARFHLGTGPSAEPAADEADVAAVITSAVQRLDHATDAVREICRELDQHLERLLSATVSRLDVHTIHTLAARLPQYLRTRRGRAVLGGFAGVPRAARRLIDRQLVRMVYRRSEGLVLVDRLRRGAHDGAASMDRVRRFVDSVSPDPAVLEQLPDYYRQLFSGRPSVGEEALAGFTTELSQALEAWRLHVRGRAGALVVLGEQGQGRGTLCGLIAGQLERGGPTLRVSPPASGSVDPAVFVARLGQALGRAVPSVIAAAHTMPRDAVLIIEDLERWWERSAEGGAVLDAIDTLIARTPAFVIVHANTRTFRLINRVRPLDDRILRVVECQPLNAERLREVILLRHAATGLEYTLDGRTGDQLSDLRLARLFDDYFLYSEGNVGVALDTWLASIRGIDDDGRLRITRPRPPGTSPFDAFDETQVMLLAQFVLHERLTAGRLARITDLDTPTLAREIRLLERTGVLVEDGAGVLRIDRFLRPHIVRFLAEREVL